MKARHLKATIAFALAAASTGTVSYAQPPSGGGTITFVGAIVAPTCNATTLGVVMNTDVAQPCASNAAQMTGTHTAKSELLSTSSLAQERMMTYFATYNATNGVPASSVRLVTYTYQ